MNKPFMFISFLGLLVISLSFGLGTLYAQSPVTSYEVPRDQNRATDSVDLLRNIESKAPSDGCPPAPIAFGQTINGTLTTNDCIFTETSRYVDVFSFHGTAGQQVAVSMNSTAFDTFLYLIDPEGYTEAEDDDGGEGINSRIPPDTGFLTLSTTGTYVIYASSYSSDSTGSYSLSLIGGTVGANCVDSLAPTNQIFTNTAGTDSFSVFSTPNCSWTAVSNVNWITTNSTGSGNGSVSYTVLENTGGIRTGTINVGGQIFTVFQSAGGGSGCPSTTIVPGQTINATLTTDCVFTGTDRYVKFYAFSGTAGQQIAITMESNAFDTYLFLADSNYTTLEQDDDGGGGTNSRIPAMNGYFTLPYSGSYWIYATSYSSTGTTGSTGTYTISLLSPAGGCTPFSISSQPQSNTKLINETGTLSVGVTGTGPFTYQWYKGARGDTNNPITGATAATYSSSSASFDRSKYWIRIRNSCGTALDSDIASLVFTDRIPLVFVPGVAGSVIRDDQGVIWPDGPALSLCSTLDRMAITATNITASDIIWNSPPLNDNVYSKLILTLAPSSNVGPYRLSGQSQTLFTLPYDWRKTNSADGSSQVLKNKIQEIKTLFPGIKVDLIAHSMGGMVAQRYIMDNIGNHSVNKVVTIGTPYLGAPKAIDVLETGEFLDVAGIAFRCDRKIKELSENFPGMHELLPSNTYFNHEPALKPFAEDGWDFDGDGDANEGDYAYDNLVHALDRKYGGSAPGSANLRFHSLAGQDDGSVAPNDISFYHIYGKTSVAKTTGKITAKKTSACIFGHCVSYDHLVRTLTAGDKTVPLLSAARLPSLIEPRNRIFLAESPSADQDRGAEHVGLCGNINVINKIIEILNDPDPLPLSTSFVEERVPMEESSQPAYYVQVVGNGSVTISDGTNIGTLSNDSRPLNIPGVDTFRMGENSFQMVLAADREYSVTLRTNNSPLLIDITRGNEKETTTASRYQDLVLPTNLDVLLRLTPQNIEHLKYDSNGDGVFETSVTPTAFVAGATAKDITPPTVTITGSGQSHSRLITIRAEDALSGVKAISYSRDGTNFMPYTGPFNIDTTQRTVVYAFADDNVANRSGLVSHSLLADISGRVTTPSGLGLRNASVSVIDSLGVIRTVLTNQLGFYKIEQVLTDEIYTVAVTSKRFRFLSRQLIVNGNLADIDFMGLE